MNQLINQLGNQMDRLKCTALITVITILVNTVTEPLLMRLQIKWLDKIGFMGII